MYTPLEDRLADRSKWQADDCSIGKAVEVIGIRSAMLIIREAWYGTTRFDDFAQRVGITDAVAASRLKQLVAIGILDKRPYRESGQRTRYEYVLTAMGRDLLPAVIALMQWGDKYLQPDGGPLHVIERETRAPVAVTIGTTTGSAVDVGDLEVIVNQDWLDGATP